MQYIYQYNHITQKEILIGQAENTEHFKKIIEQKVVTDYDMQNHKLDGEGGVLKLIEVIHKLNVGYIWNSSTIDERVIMTWKLLSLAPDNHVQIPYNSWTTIPFGSTIHCIGHNTENKSKIILMMLQIFIKTYPHLKNIMANNFEGYDSLSPCPITIVSSNTELVEYLNNQIKSYMFYAPIKHITKYDPCDLFVELKNNASEIIVLDNVIDEKPKNDILLSGKFTNKSFIVFEEEPKLIGDMDYQIIGKRLSAQQIEKFWSLFPEIKMNSQEILYMLSSYTNDRQSVLRKGNEFSSVSLDEIINQPPSEFEKITRSNTNTIDLPVISVSDLKTYSSYFFIGKRTEGRTMITKRIIDNVISESKDKQLLLSNSFIVSEIPENWASVGCLCRSPINYEPCQLVESVLASDGFVIFDEKENLSEDGMLSELSRRCELYQKTLVCLSEVKNISEICEHISEYNYIIIGPHKTMEDELKLFKSFSNFFKSYAEMCMYLDTCISQNGYLMIDTTNTSNTKNSFFLLK